MADPSITIEVSHDLNRMLAVEWDWEDIEGAVFTCPQRPRLVVTITDMGPIP